MKKLAAPSFIGMLCALMLVASSADSFPLQSAEGSLAASSSGAAGTEPVSVGTDADAVTVPAEGPSAADLASSPLASRTDGGATAVMDHMDVPTATEAGTQAALPPSGQDAGQKQPGPESSTAKTQHAAISAPTAAATPTSTESPEVPSIPPLWAPDEELNAPGASRSAPEADSTATPFQEPEQGQAQALVPDSNAAAILTVFNRINEYRVSKGLGKVKYHATVAGLAQEWSDNIATREVIEHRANFWQDPRALNPNNGAGEVIAIRTDRDAAMLVEWWKTSPGHNAMLLDPRFNVMGAGITYTDRLYQIWGVVNFFGYTTLPAGTTDAPGSTIGGGGSLPAPPPPTMCDAPAKHMPPTLDLSSAAITGPGDLVGIDAAGQIVNRPSLGGRNYGPPRIIGSGFGSAKELFTPDWDRDGAYDLLTQWTNGDLTLHRGIAGGGFHPPVKLGAGGWNTLTLAVGTWCANNRMPQILALDTAGNLFLYPNKGLGDLSARVTISTGVFANRLSMVDYDVDGFQDLIGLRADGSVQLYRGGGKTSLRAESRPTVATGWGDVTGFRPLLHVTGLNSTGLALRRANDSVQYWDLSGGNLAAPSNIPGSWTGIKLAQ